MFQLLVSFPNAIDATRALLQVWHLELGIPGNIDLLSNAFFLKHYDLHYTKAFERRKAQLLVGWNQSQFTLPPK